MGGDHAPGYYLPLTIIADVDNQSHLARNEVFGPVLAVTPFDTEEEAIALANDSDFGLGAYVHTQNLRRAHVMASALEAGMVQVNGAGEGMAPCAPFGGYKQAAMAGLAARRACTNSCRSKMYGSILPNLGVPHDLARPN